MMASTDELMMAASRAFSLSAGAGRGRWLRFDAGLGALLVRFFFPDVVKLVEPSAG